MSSFIDQQEIPSFQGEAATVETAVPQQLQIEDSEERFPFPPILHHEPETIPHTEVTPESITTSLDAFKVRNGGVDVFTGPWLPPRVKKLLEKASRTERDLVGLMEMVAERASIYFELSEGKFVAMTFHGQIMEVADTRLGLLKKIHGRRYREQIFVWRVGSNTFSGRI